MFKWSMYNYFVFDEEDFTCYNKKTGAVLFGEVKRFDANSLNCKALELAWIGNEKGNYFYKIADKGQRMEVNMKKT